MKKYLLILACILCLQNVFAQTDTSFKPCGTEDIDTTEFQQLPWFDNNQFLENFLDSIGYPSAASRIVGSPVRFWIPLKFWIYRDDNGVGGPTPIQIQLMVDKLNRIYNQQNNSMIGFYLKCEPTYINNSQHLIKTFVGASLLMAANRDAGSINIHVVDRLNFAEGMTLKPLGACIVNRATYLSTDNYTLPHEMGHALGLIHTHIFWDWQIKCFRECVSRTRTWPLLNLCIGNRIRSKRVCESTGDGLSDTQADPRLLSNFSCNYTAQGGLWATDLWGDSYSNPPNGPQEIPNTRNVMSYQGLNSCVDQFSRLQIAVMLYNLYILNGTNGAAWRNPIHTFDSYEPDNEPLTARNINIGETQERNFHQQFNILLGNPIPLITQCDVDWVRFVPNCSANLAVTTTAIANRPNANTRLTLFDNALTQLAQNDNISSTNLYSSLSWNFVANQEYFIRVENMQNLVTGYYNLLIGSANSTQIDGDNAFCNTSNLYSVAGLALGATVQWFASPAGLVTINTPNASQTTLTKIGDGVITLTARITPACGTVYEVLKNNIVVGKGAPFASITTLNATCEYTSTWTSYFYGVCKEVPGAISYDWYTKDMTNNSNPYKLKGNGYSVDFPLKPGNRLYNIKLIVTTACGNLERIEQVYAPNCVNSGKIQLNPNPVTNTLNLSVVEAKENLNYEIQKIIITDKMGNIILQKKYSIGTKKASLQINNLKSDIYFLKTWDGKNWTTIQFVKE